MLQGTNYVYKCPKCDNLITKGSLTSGNTFGAKLYSDGKSIAPMLPEFPDLIKCKKCDFIFWLSKSKEIGSYEWEDKSNAQWQNMDNAEFLTIDEYFEALELKVAENSDEELFIRQRIWWAFNDRIRNGFEQFQSEIDKAKWKGNVEALLKILDRSNVTQKIMIAELNRNIGDFENCMELINSIETPKMNWLKDAFRNECVKRNKLVFQLK
jgi:hypothetical protein